LRRLRKNRRGNSQSNQRAKRQFKSHLSVPVGPKRTSGILSIGRYTTPRPA
jgi:hypothetical protein